MVVISVSLPTKQLTEFDRIIEELGYPSRSDALRDAIHKFIQDHLWMHGAGHAAHFLMSVLYEDRAKDRVSRVLHRFREAIYNSAHSHLDGKCVDQLIVRGGENVAQNLVKELSGIRDVRVCNCIV